MSASAESGDGSGTGPIGSPNGTGTGGSGATSSERPTNASTDADLEPSALKDDGARRVFRVQLTGMCEAMLGVEPTKFEFPGGSRRDSCRMALADGRTVIGTVRGEPDRAELEAYVLSALAPHGAPVPAILARNRRLLFQADGGATRLSVALHRAGRTGAEPLLDRALASLVSLQAAGEAAGLAERAPLLGVADWWIERLIDRPVALGSLLRVKPPAPETDHMRDLLAVLEPRFVKWDARPANAVVDDEGAVVWIDFEHCGARNPLDDLAWLLGDEFVPLDPTRDERLVARYASRFGGSLPEPLLHHYAWVMLVLHGTHRLNLIINAHGGEDGDGWRSAERCVRRDSVGVARKFALRQCERLEHHASQSSLTAPLAPFYRKCRKAVAKL